MDFGIKGRTALITGGSSGLGLGAAKALCEEGVNLILASRSQSKLDNAKQTLEQLGTTSEISTICYELTNADSAEDLLRRVTGTYPQIDILVANSGGPRAGGFFDMSPSDLQDALDRNFLAMASLVQGVVPAMVSQGWGRIVAITSLWVRQPSGNLILSNAARTGLTAYLKTAASAVAPSGITINTLQPGLHATERLSSLGGDPKEMANSVPAKRLGEADEFGAVAAFLCSNQAGYINGCSIPIDGGLYSGLM